MSFCSTTLHYCCFLPPLWRHAAMNYTWADVTKKSLNTCGVRYFIPGSLQQVTQICFRHKLSHNKGTLFCFETEKQIIQTLKPFVTRSNKVCPRAVISLKTPVSARSHARAERYLPEIWFHTNPPTQQEGGKPVSTYSSSVNYHKWTSNTHTHTISCFMAEDISGEM